MNLTSIADVFSIYIRETIFVAISDSNMRGNFGIVIKSNMWYVKKAYVSRENKIENCPTAKYFRSHRITHQNKFGSRED